MKHANALRWALAIVLVLIMVLPAGGLEAYASRFPGCVWVEYTVGEPVTIKLKSVSEGERGTYRWCFEDETPLGEIIRTKIAETEFPTLTYSFEEKDHGRAVRCFYGFNAATNEYVLQDKGKMLPHVPYEAPSTYQQPIFLYEDSDDIVLSVPEAQTGNPNKKMVYRWYRENEGGGEPLIQEGTEPTLKRSINDDIGRPDYVWAGYFCKVGYLGEEDSFLDYASYFTIQYYHYKLETLAPTVADKVEEVPETIKKEASVETVEELTQYLVKKLEEQTGADQSNTQESGYRLYDIVLKATDAKGDEVTVNGQQFPANGVEIRIQYPEGTSRWTHDFSVAHIFEKDGKLYEAGAIEYPTVTKKDDGLYVRLNGTSPVLVRWTAASQQNGAKPPRTGDCTPLELLFALLTLSGVTAVALAAAQHRRRKA